MGKATKSMALNDFLQNYLISQIGTNTVIRGTSIFSIIEWTDWIMENGTMYEKFSRQTIIIGIQITAMYWLVR